MSLTAAALIAGGIASAAGALGGAYNNRKAREEENSLYNRLSLENKADIYRNPMDSIGGRALLKGLDERAKAANEAIDNRMAAGGATVENTLAAKQNVNDMYSDTFTRALLNEDARQQAARNTQKALDAQHSQSVQNSYRENAQNWSQWGASTANALTQFGLASYLNGDEFSLLGNKNKVRIPTEAEKQALKQEAWWGKDGILVGSGLAHG